MVPGAPRRVGPARPHAPRDEETLSFYRDIMGLPVLGTFYGSYGLGGMILGLPGGQVHVEIVRAAQAPYPGIGLDQLVFYLPDAAARERVEEANATELACPCSGKAIGSPIGSRNLSRKNHLTSRDGGI